MKKNLINIFLLLSINSFAQEYNYVHYDTKDGLAGSTVYRICEDKQGYLWFATDNGVSKFDGKRFVNYTTEEGLTDNDVLWMTSDSKGRVWMMPFNKSVCYYLNGKIYNNKTDSSLRDLPFTSWVVSASENKEGEIYFATTDGMFLFDKAGKFRQIADYKKLAVQFNVVATDFVPGNMHSLGFHGDRMILFNQHKVFIESPNGFEFYKTIRTNPIDPNNSLGVDDSLEMIYPSPKLSPAFTTITILNNNEYLYNTLDGAWLLDKNGEPDPKKFLPGKKVSNSFRDREGNLWFSTIGEGVYRLTSRSMITFANGNEAFCIDNVGDNVYAGYANGQLKMIRDNEVKFQQDFDKELKGILSRRLYTMKADTNGDVFLGFDLHIARVNGTHHDIRLLRQPIKSIDIFDKDYIVVCTNSKVAKFRRSDFEMTDVLFEERGTKVIYDAGYYYIGTLDGLVVIDDATRTVVRMGKNNPLLNKRIVDMCKMADGSIWIATNDNGVLLFKNQKIDTVINSKNGMTSNICRSLYADKNYLWVGTNKGLNKIDLRTRKVLINYSVSDGLASDVINAIYARDSMIWVCTPAGVTYFNERKIADSSSCLIDMNAIRVSGKTVMLRSPAELPYKDNNISFDFTAISFKSAGDITYKYKLTGLDNDWQETRQNTLAYPSLPPGDYVLNLYAVNKFGKSSEIITFPFSITTPFWRSVWFWILLSLFAIGVGWYLISLRYKHLENRMREKNNLMSRMRELEQASLRAQMNPHFIFNCLNSIQHFILQDDIKQTNRYITHFGSLIRQTMDNSARAVISIADEINYLTSYLELEQMRFSSSFQYEIKVDPAIHSETTYIPSMLLQPFVENAIRHGIRNKRDGSGCVKISMEKKNDSLIVEIEDNGIGRELAAKYKSEQHIEYQSKGTSLTQKRIDILNSNYNEKVTTRFEDLKDSNGCPSGTRVTIIFPITIIEKLH